MVDEKMKNFPEIDYASLPIHPSDAVSICDWKHDSDKKQKTHKCLIYVHTRRMKCGVGSLLFFSGKWNFLPSATVGEML
jgi:hypothetical protein